jgi:hypothetical protein
MPKPRRGEGQDHFISRCVSQVVAEGRPQDQAVAICYSMWKDTKKEALETYQEEQDVVFMMNAQPKFVSLVKRGANQTPWTVVKNDKSEGGTVAKRVLQSVIAPVETDVEVLKSVLGEDVDLSSKTEIGEIINYEILPRTACKEDTYEMVILDEESGIRGLVADLDDVDDRSFVMKLFKPRQTRQNVIEVGEDVQKADFADMRVSLEDALQSRVYKLMDEVGEVLSDSGDRLEAVKAVLDDFYQFTKDTFSVAKSEPLDALEIVSVTPAYLEEALKVGAKISGNRLTKLKQIQTLIASVIAEVEGESGSTTKAPKEWKCPECGAMNTMKEDTCLATEKCSGKRPAQKDDGQSKDADDIQKNEGEIDMTEEQTQKMVSDALNPLTETLKGIQESLTTINTEFTSLRETVGKMQKHVPGMVQDRTTDDVSVVKTDSRKWAADDVKKSDQEVFGGFFTIESGTAAGE